MLIGKRIVRRRRAVSLSPDRTDILPVFSVGASLDREISGVHLLTGLPGESDRLVAVEYGREAIQYNRQRIPGNKAARTHHRRAKRRIQGAALRKAASTVHLVVQGIVIDRAGGCRR